MPRPTLNQVSLITLRNHAEGINWGEHAEATWYFTVTDSWVHKDAAIASNHVNATPYSMWAVRRLGETPPRIRSYNGQSGSNEVNVIEEVMLSSKVTDIPYWSVSDGALAKAGNAFARASTEVRNKLNSDNQFQTLTFAAEAKEASSMLAQAASQLWRAQLAARKGRWGEVGEILQLSRRKTLNGSFPHNRWLEYQYGWKPLTSDCYSLYKHIRSLVKNELQLKVHYTAKWDHVLHWQRNTEESDGGVTAVLVVRMANSLQHDMQQWGLINPLSVAWELVPFSFCIDWGIPIGNYLNSISATAGLEFVSGYFSEKSRTTWTIKSEEYSSPGREVIDPGEFRFQHVSFKRSLMAGFPVPQLYGANNPFNTARVANAVALASTLFTGYRGPRL